MIARLALAVIAAVAVAAHDEAETLQDQVIRLQAENQRLRDALSHIQRITADALPAHENSTASAVPASVSLDADASAVAFSTRSALVEPPAAMEDAYLLSLTPDSSDAIDSALPAGKDWCAARPLHVSYITSSVFAALLQVSVAFPSEIGAICGWRGSPAALLHSALPQRRRLPVSHQIWHTKV